MYTFKLAALTLIVAAALISPLAGAGEAVAIVTDNTGNVRVGSNGSETPVDVGTALSVGDMLILDAGAQVSLLTFSNCAEVRIGGEDKLLIEKTRVKSRKTGYLRPARHLQVCYNPEDFDSAGSESIGGYIMRGMPKKSGDPMDALRKEADSGKASATVLMTLVMHEIQSGKPERARPYYESMRKRHPDSPWVKDIARYFPPL